MASSQEYDDSTLQLDFIPYLCESSRFSPHIHAEEAYAVSIPCAGNSHKNIVTCKDTQIYNFINEVGTLNMHRVHLKGVDLSLGKIINVIPKSFFDQPARLVPFDIVGISVNDIFVENPTYLKNGQFRVRQILQIDNKVLHKPIFHNKKVILFFDERDVLLERLWWDRAKLNLYDMLSQIDFYAITTPNFSVFRGECPVGQALNIKKGLVFGEELEKRGVTVIPHIYAVHQRQLERWSDWLKKHPTVKTIAMNCQLQRRSEAGKQIVITALRHLLKHTNTHILLNGGGKWILSELMEYKNRLHIASSETFKKHEIFNLSNKKSNHTISQDLFKLD